MNGELYAPLQHVSAGRQLLYVAKSQCRGLVDPKPLNLDPEIEPNLDPVSGLPYVTVPVPVLDKNIVNSFRVQQFF